MGLETPLPPQRVNQPQNCWAGLGRVKVYVSLHLNLNRPDQRLASESAPQARHALKCPLGLPLHGAGPPLYLSGAA